MRVTFDTCGLEHLGIEALSVEGRQPDHQPTPAYEARPFSSDSGKTMFSRATDSTPDAFNDAAGG